MYLKGRDGFGFSVHFIPSLQSASCRLHSTDSDALIMLELKALLKSTDCIYVFQCHAQIFCVVAGPNITAVVWKLLNQIFACVPDTAIFFFGVVPVDSHVHSIEPNVTDVIYTFRQA